MNAEMIEIGVEATMYRAAPSVGVVRIRPLEISERIRNGLAKLGTFWGVGLVCVFFPIVHLVLVPLCLMLGLQSAWKATQVRGLIVSGSVPCPGCGEPCVLSARLAQWPMTAACVKCGRQIGICPAQ